MSQQERDRVMAKARAGTVDLLVATDVAARGIDIEHLTHVVNFDVPSSPEAYVHRIGRTGRAGREGVAITLVDPRGHRLLRNIEQVTKQKIAISTVPTPLDVKARRLDVTKGALREALLAGELDRYRVVVETLAAEFDPMDVAAAAVRLAHEASEGESAEDDVHIPAIDGFRQPGPPQGAPPRGWGAPPQARGPRSPQDDDRFHAPRRHEQRDMVRVYIGAGTRMGMRPADLVGAISNEADINPRAIGGIEIAEMFSIVELPARDVDHVIRALRGATLRGRKVKVNRDLGFRNPPPPPR
jgi:ATP-dependent RNA helicase DeaD